MGQDSPAVPLRMLFCRLQFLCEPAPLTQAGQNVFIIPLKLHKRI